MLAHVREKTKAWAILMRSDRNEIGLTRATLYITIATPQVGPQLVVFMQVSGHTTHSPRLFAIGLPRLVFIIIIANAHILAPLPPPLSLTVSAHGIALLSTWAKDGCIVWHSGGGGGYAIYIYSLSSVRDHGSLASMMYSY
jgi:hypothetical protein